MARRKRGNRSLPPGLYCWQQDRKTLWRIGKMVAGKRRWTQLGEMTRDEALAAYHALNGAPDPNPSSSRSRTSTGWSDYVSTVYLPHVRDHKAPKTLEAETRAAGWLSAYFQDTRLEAIDTAAIEEFKRWRREHGGRRGKKGPRVKPSARTVNLDLHTLSKALRHAATLGLIPRAPTVVKLPEARERKESRWLTAEQIAAVLEATSEDRYLLLLFAFHTGMRPGEITTRHREDIDLEQGFVRVGHRGEFRVKRERPRVVPLSPALHKAIEAAWSDLPEDGPIFAGQSLKESLRRACKKAGIPTLNAYGTRHSFVSRWAQEGRSREALIKIVGHADGRMIDQVYAHFGASELADHMARVGWQGTAKVIDLHASKDRAVNAD